MRKTIFITWTILYLSFETHASTVSCQKLGGLGDCQGQNITIYKKGLDSSNPSTPKTTLWVSEIADSVLNIIVPNSAIPHSSVSYLKNSNPELDVLVDVGSTHATSNSADATIITSLINKLSLKSDGKDGVNGESSSEICAKAFKNGSLGIKAKNYWESRSDKLSANKCELADVDWANNNLFSCPTDFKYNDNGVGDYLNVNKVVNKRKCSTQISQPICLGKTVDLTCAVNLSQNVCCSNYDGTPLNVNWSDLGGFFNQPPLGSKCDPSACVKEAKAVNSYLSYGGSTAPSSYPIPIVKKISITKGNPGKIILEGVNLNRLNYTIYISQDDGNFPNPFIFTSTTSQLSSPTEQSAAFRRMADLPLNLFLSKDRFLTVAVEYPDYSFGVQVTQTSVTTVALQDSTDNLSGDIVTFKKRAFKKELLSNSDIVSVCKQDIKSLPPIKIAWTESFYDRILGRDIQRPVNSKKIERTENSNFFTIPPFDIIQSENGDDLDPRNLRYYIEDIELEDTNNTVVGYDSKGNQVLGNGFGEYFDAPVAGKSVLAQRSAIKNCLGLNGSPNWKLTCERVPGPPFWIKIGLIDRFGKKSNPLRLQIPEGRFSYHQTMYQSGLKDLNGPCYAPNGFCRFGMSFEYWYASPPEPDRDSPQNKNTWTYSYKDLTSGESESLEVVDMFDQNLLEGEYYAGPCKYFDRNTQCQEPAKKVSIPIKYYY